MASYEISTLNNTSILNPFSCEEKGATNSVVSSLLAGAPSLSLGQTQNWERCPRFQLF